MKHILSILAVVACFFEAKTQQKVFVRGEKYEQPDKKEAIFGTLLDSENNEGLIGAIVRIQTLDIATVTDINGTFKIRVPVGNYLVETTSVGYTPVKFLLIVEGKGSFVYHVKPDTTELDAVVVSGNKVDANITSTNPGKNSLSIESIKQLPKAMGEIDIIKSIALLPGVSASSELSSGFNVRGGSTDQNLILLGDVPIYNPSHLFGFYTAFNAEVIDDVNLYKGAIPASYGGRASSVLHVKYRDGDYIKWKTKAQVGVVSSNLTIEGPLLKNKVSVLLSARKSYVNWLLGAFKNPDISESSAAFYDYNGILNWRLNDRNKLTYSIYGSGDNFNFVGDTTYYWSNFNQSLKWNHSFTDNLNLKANASLSSYRNEVFNDGVVNAFHLTSEVKNAILNLDIEYLITPTLSLTGGFNMVRTELNPGEFTPAKRSEKNLNHRKAQREYGTENALYLQGDYEINEQLSISLGLRYSHYQYLGAHNIYTYIPYKPFSALNITDTIAYGTGDMIQSYDGWEPRVSARVSITPSTSIKGAYNRMYQYIHLISNTTTIAPNDIWKLSDNYIKPQIADQASLGIYKNFNDNIVEVSFETFYKTIQNVIDYKDGADLLLNDHIESELLDGLGKSYGLEFYLRKKSQGRFTGWISYTFSKSLRQVEGSYMEVETINRGEWYPASFDRTHIFTNVLVYKLPRKWELSSTFSLKTGQVFTKPIGKFYYSGQLLPVYKDRNNARGPFYHRLDVSLTRAFTFLKKYQGEFNFSVYNLYGRKNPFSIYFQDVYGSPPQPYKLAILGIPFPSVSITLNF